MGQREMEQLCHGQDCKMAHKTVEWKRLCPGICWAVPMGQKGPGGSRGHMELCPHRHS